LQDTRLSTLMIHTSAAQEPDEMAPDAEEDGLGAPVTRAIPAAKESEPPLSIRQSKRLFPPTLVPLLRERLGSSRSCIAQARDEILEELFSLVFFAGLETEEGERFAVRVLFAGENAPDMILPQGESPRSGPMLVYRWTSRRFASPRPCTVRELVKLSVVTQSDHLYARVELVGEKLFVTGIAREGVNVEEDAFVKIISPRPGVLSIRMGRERVLEYDRGVVLSGAASQVFSGGLVRRSVESLAAKANIHPETVGEYVDAVRAVVHEMSAHGRGGILVISPEDRPRLPEWASYRMVSSDSIGSLVVPLHVHATQEYGPLGSPRHEVALSHLLRSAFEAELQHTIEEFGSVTALDGATVLNHSLGLVGFGVVLPVVHDVDVVEAFDPQGTTVGSFPLSNRGTRHRAAITYASQNPGSVVFIASADGPMGCALRPNGSPRTLVWRFGPEIVRRRR
jgi:Probable sensor domain DACNV